MEALDRVIKVITKHFGMPDGEVLPHKAIVDDLGADSLDTIELVMAIEEEFNIEIPEHDLISRCNTFTVQDAANMVNSII